MPRLSWPMVRERRILLLVGLLALTFLLTAILAYQAQDAARSHRDTAERTLRDYAEYAAVQYAIHAKEGIYARVTDVLYRGPKPDHGTHAAAACDADSPALFSFYASLPQRVMIDSRGCTPPAAVVTWLLDSVGDHAEHHFNRKWEHADLVRKVDGEKWLVTYGVGYDADDRPVKMWGVGMRFAPFAWPVLRDVMRNYPLLPPALAGAAPAESLLAVVVRDGEGVELFRSSPQYESPFTGEYTMDKFGGLQTSVALRPAAAERLVIGGLPRSRLPLLLGLTLLTGTLVIVAFRQLQREYELSRLRSDFISSISHELRTPLAQVRMFAETLLLGRVRSDGERRRSLEIIDQEARRLTHLVENVLLFSRSERQLTRHSPEPTALAGLLREVVEAFAPIAQARKVTVRAELVDGVEANVDRDAMRQTVLNLLDNAVKYGPTGQTVTLAMTAPDAFGRVRLSVCDEGPGVAPRERERIWAPFYRLDRDACSAVAGSGIGLAVVRDLVAQHGGRVWVEDAPGGQGARFVVELPHARRLADAPADVAAPSADAPPRTTHPEESPV